MLCYELLKILKVEQYNKNMSNHLPPFLDATNKENELKNFASLTQNCKYFF